MTDAPAHNHTPVLVVPGRVVTLPPCPNDCPWRLWYLDQLLNKATPSPDPLAQDEPSPEALAEMPEVHATGTRGYYAIRFALQGPDPISRMREIASAQLAAGFSRDQVCANFERVRAELDDDEEQQERVMTVMDHIVGWCNPRHAL